jgi:hypothetical protein
VVQGWKKRLAALVVLFIEELRLPLLFIDIGGKRSYSLIVSYDRADIYLCFVIINVNFEAIIMTILL